MFAAFQERGSPFRTSGPGRRHPRCNPGIQLSPLLRWPVDIHCTALYLPSFVNHTSQGTDCNYTKVISGTFFTEIIDKFLSQRECDMIWCNMGDGNSITAIMAKSIPLRLRHRSTLY